MMMSRNSVTSYFGKRLKGWYSVHSHWHKSGGNFTKVIELHKTKISEGGIRPKKDLSKQWKGRRCHLSQAPSIWDEGSRDQLRLRRAQPRGTAAALLSHTLRQLCSGQRKLGGGSQTPRADGATPKEATGKIRSLNFTVTPTHLGQSQAKVQGCPEPVCLAREQTPGLRWISWRYGRFLTLCLSPWQTQLPLAEGHRLLLASAPNCLYSDKFSSSVLPQVTHTHYFTFGENANFSIQYQLHSFLGMSHSPLRHEERLSTCTALPCTPYGPPNSCPQLQGTAASHQRGPHGLS